VTREPTPLDLPRLYQRVFEQHIDDAAFLLDPAGTIVSWSAGVQNILGWARDEFVGRPFAIIFSPEDVAAGCPPQELAAARVSGARAGTGWRIKRDGTRFWAEGRLRAIHGDGDLIGFAVRLHDAAPTDEAAELRRRVAEFETLLDVIPVGIGIARDPLARDIRVNRAFADVLRLERDANASLSAPEGERPRHFRALRDGRELAPEELPLQLAAMERRTIRDVQLDIVFDSGERVHLLEYAAPLFDDDGAVRGSVGAFVNVTELREAALTREELLAAERTAREEAERSNRIKDEFLAGLSHELRTPLNAILGWAHLLRKSEHASADTQQGLEIIERNARLQARLIDDLLDMSRILSGRIRLDMQEVSFTTVVEAAVEAIRPSAEAKGVELLTRLEATGARVMGDPVRLQQVAWNLLSNAVKFTPRGSQISVTLRHVGPQLELEVADAGVGITADFLPFVFDRFRQADGSTKRRFSGLGIGLSIVKDLVELHGGSVHARSEGDNRGATFTVSLRATAAASSDAVGAPQGAHVAALVDAPNLTGVMVLVIEDDTDSRELVSAILSASGATVTSVASAAAALDALARLTPDVIVSDIGLPDHDGYELIRAIREDSGDLSLVPALALTAYARSDDRRRALSAGFQVHMCKPIEPAELCAAVAGLARKLQTS
jgi:PAS domain S-box-containing protein